MTTNNNRKTKVTIGVIAAVIFIIWLLCQLRGCGSVDYTMQLNGDNPFEIALNSQYIEPGVTFFDEDGNQVSDDKQAELEKELTIINKVDTSVAGEYPVTYEYGKQLLERTVKVLAGNSDNNTDNNTGTKEPTDTDQKPGDTSNENQNNGNNGNNGNGNNNGTQHTPGPGNNEDTDTQQKKVYHLPSDVEFNSRTVTYNGEEFTITASNIPYGIIPVYTNNSGTNAGRYDAEVVFVLSEMLKSQYSLVEPASLTATLTICQAKPSYTVPTGLTAKEGETLADVKLPKGFSFEKALTTPVGNVGYHTFLVTFTPDDTVNYKTVYHIEVIIHVTNGSGGGGGGGDEEDHRVVYYLPSSTIFNGKTVTYNGSRYSIFAEGVPANIDTRYVNNSGINAGTYNATVYYTVGDALKDQCYRVEPSKMTATLTILKAVPRYTVPTGLTAYVGQTLKDVKLPKGFTFEDPLSTSVGNIGKHVFKATYTPDDTQNYEVVTGIDVTITVTDKPGPGPDPVKPTYKLPSNVTFNDVNGTYTGQTYTAVAENVPEGIIASYSNASRINAGSQQATVAFALSESMAKMYSGVEPSSMTATINIKQADPSYTVPTNLIAQEGQTLADVKGQLSKGFSFEDPLNTSVGAPGDNEFTVTYTPDDNNYKIVTGIKVTIHVTRKPDPTKPTYKIPASVVFDDMKVPYTGSEYVLEASSIPAELTAVYSNNRRTELGSQVATVTFALSDKGIENYSGIEGTATMTATLEIIKADPTYTAPGTLTAEEGQTLADIVGQLGKGFSFEDPLSTPVGAPGDHEFKVTYTPDDAIHYNTITGIKVIVRVSAKTPPDVVDKTELRKAQGIADSKTSFGYTPESFYDFQEAYKEANKMPEDTQAQVDAKTAAINAALALLKPSSGGDPQPPENVDKTALIAATEAAEAITSFGYTPESYAEFLAAYEAATKMDEDTQNQVDVKTDAINAALALLKPSTGGNPDDPDNVDKKALEEAKSKAAAITGVGYTAESYEAFAAAYALANAMDETTQAQINAKTDAINAALAMLKASTGGDPDTPDSVDKKALNDATAAAQAITGFGYTVESYEAFLAAYEAAAGMEEGTQEQINTKADAINAALALLRASDDSDNDHSENVDKSALDSAIANAGSIGSFGYTLESYEAFQNAYAAALGMGEDTQEEVSRKVDAINAAIDLLETSSFSSTPSHTENETASTTPVTTTTTTDEASTAVGETIVSEQSGEGDGKGVKADGEGDGEAETGEGDGEEGTGEDEDGKDSKALDLQPVDSTPAEKIPADNYQQEEAVYSEENDDPDEEDSKQNADGQQVQQAATPSEEEGSEE